MYYQNKSKTYFIVFVLIFAVFIQQLDSRRIGKKYFRSAREIRHNSVDQSIGCKAKPTASMYQFLNRICEDCFNVYRDTDLYHMCRYVCIDFTKKKHELIIFTKFFVKLISRKKRHELIKTCDCAQSK